MPNIEWGEGGGIRSLKNVHWTAINASVPKKFVHDYLNPIVAEVDPEKPIYAPEKSLFHPNRT